MLINFHKKIVRRIGYLLLFSIFLQIILGAWVRLTGSGMSCPDWPLCYGMIFPTPEKIKSLEIIDYTYFQIFLEWIHRANAAFIIGPIIVIFSFFLLLNKNTNLVYKKYAFALLFLLLIQGGLGGLTVFKSNIPWSVAVHLMFAFLLYLTVLLLILSTYDFSRNSILVNRLVKNNIFLIGFLTLVAACAGAFTSKYGASLSCDKWPGCSSSFFPKFDDAFELIHFGHRVIAFTLIIFLFLLFFNIRKYYKIMTFPVKLVIIFILAIIFFQVSIGALLIYFGIPTWLGIFHQGTGLLLFTFICILYKYVVFRNNKI